MKTQEARQLGQRVAELVGVGRARQAYSLLAPTLSRRTPFNKLDLIGQAVGGGPVEAVNAFLDGVAAAKTEGGWVVIGSALGQQLDRDLPGAFARCRAYAVAADVWYGADILGERVPGPALLSCFEAARPPLATWRGDANHWVRRMVGVAVHFWAKRSRGLQTLAPQAQKLLDLLEPMFEERDMDALKGIGWGLKTLGKQYADLVADWLEQQVVRRQRPCRALMLNKALTYLSNEQRARLRTGTAP